MEVWEIVLIVIGGTFLIGLMIHVVATVRMWSLIKKEIKDFVRESMEFEEHDKRIKEEIERFREGMKRRKISGRD